MWCLRSVAALVLLSAGLWSDVVSAASLESLVMPGPVAAGHAETEETCSACHSLFDQGSQGELCLDCHEPVAEDIAAGSGFHGRHPEVGTTDCRDCHAEHKGRDADITGLAIDAFDHARTGFDLTGAHARATCGDCHARDAAYRDAEPACASCHGDDDPHRRNLGSNCAACHVTDTWQEQRFDHAEETGWALTGAHANVTCTACHADQVFEDTATECAGCHALDDAHQGRLGRDCAGCHEPHAWKQTAFDHAASTGFALQGAHAVLACTSCHVTNRPTADLPKNCAGCHSTDDPHQGRRGSDCAACHQQDAWTVAFDHLDATGFQLAGAHAELQCQSCHTGTLQDPLPSECEDCHAADDPHRGQLPSCTDCHEPQGWRNSLRFDHEFTNFPLLGMHKLASCEQCHASPAFKDTGAQCSHCHAANDIHKGTMGDDCADCHSPSGWVLWAFDHAAQTGFALTGAHADLACEGCHEPGAGAPLSVSSSCFECHRADDVHAGQFGNRCERCHTTAGFDQGRLPP